MNIEIAKKVVKMLDRHPIFIKGVGAKCPLCNSIALLNHNSMKKIGASYRYYCKCTECGFKFVATD